MKYASIQQMSVKWNISKRRIQLLCSQGRISGASQVGNMWIIPEDTPKPSDARRRSPLKAGSCTDPLYVTAPETKTAQACRPSARSGRKSVLLRQDGRTLLKHTVSASLAICTEYSVDPADASLLIISVLSAVLLVKYIPSSDFGEAFATVSRDLGIGVSIDRQLLLPLKQSAERLIDDASTDEDNLISWALQYSARHTGDTALSRTQFFTEPYMADFLIREAAAMKGGLLGQLTDPCCGGGNFLASGLEYIVTKQNLTGEDDILAICRNLSGYDIDPAMARCALVNIRLRAIRLLSRNEPLDMSIWSRIQPHIWISAASQDTYGSLDLSRSRIIDLLYGKTSSILEGLGQADILLTNPPFATTKGMNPDLRDYLKAHYPECNTDMCAAFFKVAHALLKDGGVLGTVTQTSWMYLDSFRDFRLHYRHAFKTCKMVNLGAGAFQDLSGEKASVALVVSLKKPDNSGQQNISFQYTDLRYAAYSRKIRGMKDHIDWNTIFMDDAASGQGEAFRFDLTEEMRGIMHANPPYSSFAVPMQGTSTGDSANLIGYYWEHIGDSNWRSVSKGGGYCRWQGLNSYVVKWGQDGEFIRATKGSALRNTRYFDETQLVFSDTGTAGLNVRLLLPGQIFVASGPGIRIANGSAYAHLAYLNARLASSYIRALSPKLTIAAGYIAKLPVNQELLDSPLLKGNAMSCVEQKKKFLRKRAVNIEYDPAYLSGLPDDIPSAARACFIEELHDELLKLTLESQIDREILNLLHVPDSERRHLDLMEGRCACDITDEKPLDYRNLDNWIAHHLDCRAQLKRSRTDRHSLGCDGILEFTARSLDVNPAYLVREIAGHIDCFTSTLLVYEKMLLHARILAIGGFSAKALPEGVLDCDDITDNLLKTHIIDAQRASWICHDLAAYHSEYFYGRGFLKLRQEEGN